MRSKKMNGPTSRRLAVGSARRTWKPPMSLALGITISSMASQAKASPGVGSLPGKKLMRRFPSGEPYHHPGARLGRFFLAVLRRLRGFHGIEQFADGGGNLVDRLPENLLVAYGRFCRAA